MMSNCKIGLWGSFGRMPGLLSCEVCFFRVFRHKADRWSCAQTSNQFILTVFSKSVVLWTKVPFNKSEVIGFQVPFACQLGLFDVTLHLLSPLRCRVSFTAFGLIASGTLPNVHHSSVLLVIINMGVAGGPMIYASQGRTQMGGLG